MKSINLRKLKCIDIPSWLLHDKRYLSRINSHRDSHAFNLFLLLLRIQYEQNGATTFTVHKDLIIDELELMKTTHPSLYNRAIWRAVGLLQTKYKLIKHHTLQGTGLRRITLLTPPHRKPKTRLPESFMLPLVYWKHGWSKTLSQSAKYALLIALLRQESKDSPAFPQTVDRLSSFFHINDNSLCRGQNELDKYNILTIKHEQFTEDPNVEWNHMNDYTLKGLPNPIARELEIAELAEEHGKKDAKLARELAYMIDEGYNPEAIRIFIEHISTYGRRKVIKTTKHVGSYKRSSAYRTLGCITGLLRRDYLPKKR